MTNDLVGTQLGKYQLQAEIGRGGMGLVYLGYDSLLDRQVAVKVLAPHLVWETGFVERFLREARSAARLKHPGIVTIHDVGQEGSWYYIVMEYLKGYTLAQLIAQQGPMSSKRALPILRQLADALDYAHRQGLVHRDVKPGNVVVDAQGQATLTDFGVARAAQETRLTTTGALVGTPQYMSPEQAVGEELDHRADLYSLGVVAYEMLTGRAPFGATTPHAVLHQVIYDPPPSILSLRPDLPPAVDQAMSKALAKEPDARYGTAQEFVEALTQSLGQAGPGTRPPPRPVPPAAPKEVAVSETESLRQAGWGLGLAWLLVSSLGWFLGQVASRAAAEYLIWPSLGLFGQFVDETLAGAASWAVLGLLMGVGQWLVLRRYIRRAGWWILATVVGWALVGAFKWLQGPVMDEWFFDLAYWVESMGPLELAPLLGIGLGMLFEAAAGLVVGAAQWFVLRQHVRRAGRWVGLNALAWSLGAAVVGSLLWTVGDVTDEMVFWMVATAGGAVAAAITAFGLVRLLARHRRYSTVGG